MRLLHVLTIIIACFTSATCVGDTTSELQSALDQLDSGIQLLESNDPSARAAMSAAAANLNSVIREYDVRTAEAYHALGNAHTLNGDLGHAMLAYRRGEQIDPRNIRIKDSIEHIRDQVQVTVEPSVPNRIRSVLISWRGIIPRDWIWMSGVGFFIASWCVLALGIRSKEPKPYRVLGIVLLVASLFPFTALWYEWSYTHSNQAVVIIQDDVMAMSGPDDAIYDPVYSEPLQSGVEASLIESRDQWGKLVLIDGSECWVPLNAIEPISLRNRVPIFPDSPAGLDPIAG